MNPRLRRRLGVALVILVLAVTSFALLSRVFGRSRLRFPYLTGTLDPAHYSALSSKPGWSATSLEVAPGIQLRGLLRRPAHANAPWVLFYPGNDDIQLERGQAFLSRVAGDQDFGLAVFAYRGYNSSGGSARLEELAADAPKILAGLCAQAQVPPARVHVVGFSIGGHLAVRAVGREARRGAGPRSLALLASVDDIVMFRRSPWQKLDPGDDFQTRPFLADVPAPVLVIQGTDDEAMLGPEQGRAIAGALGTKARYLELPGVGHSALLENERALSELRAFILGNMDP